MSQALMSRALISQTLMSQAEPARGWRHRFATVAALPPPLAPRTTPPGCRGWGHGAAPWCWTGHGHLPGAGAGWACTPSVGDPTVWVGWGHRGWVRGWRAGERLCGC